MGEYPHGLWVGKPRFLKQDTKSTNHEQKN